MTAQPAGMAPRLAALAQQLAGRPLPIGLRAYDGSEAGLRPADAGDHLAYGAAPNGLESPASSGSPTPT